MKAGLCLIARLKSQRLPRKALVDIHGKPALAHLFERAHLCQSVERAILCTSTDPDDAPLLRLARQYNFQSYAGSPEQPLERMIACAETYGWQYIVRATADNIFLDPDLVEKSVTYAMDQNLDYVFTRGVPIGTHCEVFSLSALRSIQQYADAPYTTEYLTWFVTDTDNFHAMDLPIPDSLKRNYRLTLDTPDDLRNICDVMERLKEISVPYTLIDVIRVVESNPDLQRRCVFEPKYEPPPTKVHFKFNIKLPA
jgi:spore coat polysaccharide biosynthesis protein SpsF (cytidylyltransferase family)